MNQKRIVEWFAYLAGAGLAIYGALWVWWAVSLPGDEEHAAGHRLAEAAKQVSAYPNQQVFFRPRRDRVDLDAYGFMDTASQDKLLAVLRERVSTGPIEVRVTFYPPRVMRETKMDGYTYGELVKEKSLREVKLN